MKIKIYQINMDRDNGSYSFTNYENTIRRTGGGIRSSIYDCVFDGDVACKGLEEIYEKFNIDSPPGFKGHSLSVRYNRIKDSVKADLDFFNGKTTAKDVPTPVKDNVR